MQSDRDTNTDEFEKASKPRDRVTISLFSKESEKDDKTFHEGMFNEYKNIAEIKAGVTKAAKAVGREPPEIVVSVNLIPNWKKKDNGYDNKDYLALKEKFLARTHKAFDDLGVRIHDFYTEAHLTKQEKAYLNGLESGGSNPDMIKTRAVIDNQDCRHLQMDSNTKIADYAVFYKQTFGAADSAQADALNASYYDSHYVSAHNKVVYTSPGGKMGPALEEFYLQYMQEHQNDADDKGPKLNNVYARVFAGTMDKLGLSRASVDPTDNWKFHPANMDQPEYRITSSVVTAVNMSWSSAAATAGVNELKSLPPVQVGDASCDYQCFTYLLKKYTGNLWQHDLGASSTAPMARDQLLAISDKKLDMMILAEFYNNACKIYVDHPEKALNLAKMIPNTKHGKALTAALFNCTVAVLYNNPLQVAGYAAKKGTSLGTTAVLIKKSIGTGKPIEAHDAKADVSEAMQSTDKKATAPAQFVVAKDVSEVASDKEKVTAGSESTNDTPYIRTTLGGSRNAF